jgi:hypothetical protein
MLHHSNLLLIKTVTKSQVTESQQPQVITTIKIRNTWHDNVENSYVNIIRKGRISGSGIRWEENSEVDFKEMVC